MYNLDSFELTSFREALKLGIIDNYTISEEGFIGYSGKDECYAAAFSDSAIDKLIDKIDPSYPLYMLRGDELAKAFLKRYSQMEGEGFLEYIYSGEPISIELGTLTIRPLDSSYIDTISSIYKVTDEAYIKKRLESGVVLGLFEGSTLLGFVGEHFEGAMGMLEVFPEYRRRGYGELLESYKINQLLSLKRVPFCNIFHSNKISPILQEKLGLVKTEMDTWWINPIKKDL